MTEPIVLVVGSLHYDIMVDAPDRPRQGETVTGTAWRPKFGGKGGNQAVAAARAGARVRMAGAVGDDAFGRFLVEQLAARGVDAACVACLDGVGSGMSVAISDRSGDYGAVIVSGANLAFDVAALARTDFWQGAAMLILQNEMPEATNLAAATLARASGIRVCLNAAPHRPLSEALVGMVDLLVVNAIEAEQLCGVPVLDLASAGTAAERLSERFPYVVVTAGGAGVAAKARGEAVISIPALPVSVVSTHGAGDAFVGSLAAALANDESLSAGLRRANAVAARHVSSSGT